MSEYITIYIIEKRATLTARQLFLCAKTLQNAAIISYNRLPAEANRPYFDIRSGK